MLVAIPPDSSLKRFIADLMLRMRVVRNRSRYLPVSARKPRGATSGGPRSRQATAIVRLLQPRNAGRDSGYILVSRGCQSASKDLSFQAETRVSPRNTRAPRALKGPSYTA